VNLHWDAVVCLDSHDLFRAWVLFPESNSYFPPFV
jgi:hypothetical protein